MVCPDRIKIHIPEASSSKVKNYFPVTGKKEQQNHSGDDENTKNNSNLDVIIQESIHDMDPSQLEKLVKESIPPKAPTR